jgi:hypothetical protein
MQVCALDCPHDWPHRPSIPNAHALGGLFCVFESVCFARPCPALPSCFLTVVCAIPAALKTCWAGAVEFFGCCVRAREYEEEEVSEHFLAGRGRCTLWTLHIRFSPILWTKETSRAHAAISGVASPLDCQRHSLGLFLLLLRPTAPATS